MVMTYANRPTGIAGERAGAQVSRGRDRWSPVSPHREEMSGALSTRSPGKERGGCNARQGQADGCDGEA